MAQIWLSDVQVLYLPNSIHKRNGGPKRFREEQDWVVGDELFYGAKIAKDFHLVVGEGIEHSEPNVWNALRDQLRNYQWQSVPTLLAGSDAETVGKRLHETLEHHHRYRTYTTHHPDRAGLKNDDVERLVRGIFRPALKARVAGIVLAVRLGIRPDSWMIANAMIRPSLRGGLDKRSNRFTAQDIFAACKDLKRTDGYPVTLNWVRAVMRRIVQGGPVATLGGKSILLAEEAGRNGRAKAYRCRLIELIDAAMEFYQIPIERKELEQAFFNAVSRQI